MEKERKKKIEDFKGKFEGIEFLRRLVRNFDMRDEDLNDNKTPHELVDEFLDVLNGDIDMFTGKPYEDEEY